MSKLSIIIPIYNVVEYMVECIDSVINQNYKNIEIILVDDGSTDGSSDICRKYNDNYDRVIYIKQSNSGLSSARNRGLDIATGDYIMFIDSDDYLANYDVIGKFVEVFEGNDYDVIYGSYTGFIDNSCSKYKINKQKKINVSNYDIKERTNEEVICLLLQSKSYYSTANTKIYKRALIEDNNLRFKLDTYQEDEQWTPQVLIKCKKIYIFQDEFYMRRYRENSIMTTKDEKRILKRIDNTVCIGNEMIKFIRSNCHNHELIEKYSEYFGTFIISSLNLCVDIKNRENLIEAKRLIKDNFELLSYTKKLKYRVIYYVYKIFKFDVTIKIVPSILIFCKKLL